MMAFERVYCSRDRRMCRYRHPVNNLRINIAIQHLIFILLLEALEQNNGVRVCMGVKLLFARYSEDKRTEITIFHNVPLVTLFYHPNVVERMEQVNHTIVTLLEDIRYFIETFEQRGSGFVLEDIIFVDISISPYLPIKVGCYVNLPKDLQYNQNLINFYSEDDYCLLWAIGMIREDFNFNLIDLDFPLKLNDIYKFENRNELSVNIYGYEKKRIYPIRVTKKQVQKHYNLLLIESDNNSYHYVGIKDFNKFVLSVRRKLRGTYYKNYFCKRCLSAFKYCDLWKKHEEICEGFQAQHVIMPEDNPVLTFSTKQISKMHKCPMVIYADFETYVIPHDKSKGSNICLKQKHIVNSFAFVVVNYEGNIFDFQQYTSQSLDENVIHIFFDYLEQAKIKIHSYMCNNYNHPLKKTPEAQKMLSEAQMCFLCGKAFTGDSIKVIDHCYATGMIRGIAHRKCNLFYSFPYGQIPVFFHNLMNFDLHFIVRNIPIVKLREGKCNIIARSIEKFLTLQFNGFQFLDSYQFLSTSLKNLVKNLKTKGIENFRLLKSFYPQNTEYLLQKSIYPYEWVDTPNKFEFHSIPSLEIFQTSYLQFDDVNISIEDYEKAQKIWSLFNCKTFIDYHNLYLNTDVLLLADVFECFRKSCQDEDNMDPCRYLTISSYCFASALKRTQIELQLLTDIDMHMFIERGIRGGYSGVVRRYSCASNKYINKDGNIFITYLDYNNLYGWCMSNNLPFDGFEWISPQDFNLWDDDDSVGYIIECDLGYPLILQDETSDFPLCPENKVVTLDMLSPYQQQLAHKHKFSSGQRLLLTLYKKENYITYHKNLQFYVKKGMILERVLKVLKFNQKKWLEPYISHNAQKRKLAVDDFEKDLFKLKNNVIYGKCLENVRDRFKVRLYDSGTDLAINDISKPTLSEFQLLSDELLLTKHKNKMVKLNKPLYLGFVVLELAKLRMYQGYYEVLKPLLGDRLKLLYTDTDSFLLEIQSLDMYEEFKDILKTHLDTSNFPTDHPLFSNENKKKIGYLKFEEGVNYIEEFCGIKPKMYAFKQKHDSQLVAKGVSTKQLTFQMYKDCVLKENESIHLQNRTMRSFAHEVFTTQVVKKGLNNLDIKRYYFDNTFSVPFGHYLI